MKKTTLLLGLTVVCLAGCSQKVGAQRAALEKNIAKWEDTQAKFTEEFNKITVGDITFELPTDVNTMKTLGFTSEDNFDYEIPDSAWYTGRFAAPNGATFQVEFTPIAGKKVIDCPIIGVTVDSTCTAQDKIKFACGFNYKSSEKDARLIFDQFTGDKLNTTYFTTYNGDFNTELNAYYFNGAVDMITLRCNQTPSAWSHMTQYVIPDNYDHETPTLSREEYESINESEKAEWEASTDTAAEAGADDSVNEIEITLPDEETEESK